MIDPDQPVLNLLLSLEPYKSITNFCENDDGWACQSASTANPMTIDDYRSKLLGPEPVFDGEFVYTSTGKKFCMVHQYDRIPEWKEKFETKYKD